MIRTGSMALLLLGILLAFIGIAGIISGIPHRQDRNTRVLETMDPQMAHQFQKDCLDAGGVATLLQSEGVLVVRCRNMDVEDFQSYLDSRQK